MVRDFTITPYGLTDKKGAANKANDENERKAAEKKGNEYMETFQEGEKRDSTAQDDTNTSSKPTSTVSQPKE